MLYFCQQLAAALRSAQFPSTRTGKRKAAAICWSNMDAEELLATLKTKEDALALPWEAVPFRRLRNFTGVYMVTSDDGAILYIGQSVNVNHRLAVNTHPAYNARKTGIIKVLPVADPALRGYYEYRLIDILKPPLNQRNGQLRNHQVPENIIDKGYKNIFG